MFETFGVALNMASCKKTPSRYRILQIDRGKKVFLKETKV